jgi:hypothetical protein
VYVPELEKTWLRFVDGCPVSSITPQFLGYCCERLEARSKEALLLIWDNASSGIRAESSEAGSPPITGKPRTEVVEYESCLACCPPRARGSTPSSPSGFSR